jgi:hypothetical protein
MFHPTAPNLRLSRMSALKKAVAKIIFLYTSGLVLASYSSGEMSLNVRVRFAFKPRGGSLVTLMPFCSTGTGNLSLGMEVSQMRNSRFTVSGSFCMRSTVSSSLDSHDTARWQFCRHTQSPDFCAMSIARSAIGPCP